MTDGKPSDRLRCWYCEVLATQIGYYEFNETQTVMEFDSEGEPVYADRTFKQFTHVWRCSNGHTFLTDWAGIGLEGDHQIERGFKRIAPDPPKETADSEQK